MYKLIALLAFLSVAITAPNFINLQQTTIYKPSQESITPTPTPFIKPSPTKVPVQQNSIQQNSGIRQTNHNEFEFDN